MLLNSRKRIFSLLFHVTVILLVLEILGVGHIFTHPVVLGAIFLSYYDLWIKQKE